MAGYDLYIFIICMIVLFATGGILTAMLTIIVRQETTIIESGLADHKIIEEYIHDKNDNHILSGLFQKVLLVITAIAILFFAASLALKLIEPKVEGKLAIPRVVLSDSMSYARESNTYLKTNGLEDQFQTFDLIFMKELPGEFELELYDVVVYQYRDELIIHRIVGIEEPNEKHPDHRLFELRGDAMKYSDVDKVEYSQMKSIYEGDRVRFVGSFIAFMQSPAGYMCILLLVVGFVATPAIERYLRKKKHKRLKEITFRIVPY